MYECWLIVSQKPNINVLNDYLLLDITDWAYGLLPVHIYWFTHFRHCWLLSIGWDISSRNCLSGFVNEQIWKRQKKVVWSNTQTVSTIINQYPQGVWWRWHINVNILSSVKQQGVDYTRFNCRKYADSFLLEIWTNLSY